MKQPELFPRIGTVSRLAGRGPVGAGCNDADFAQDQVGGQWIRKLVSKTGWEEMLAESIGYLLGTAIGAPIPEFSVCKDAGLEACASRLVPNSLGWQEHLADQVVNCEELGAIVTLDLIILNSDRHGANLLLQPDPEETRLKAWAIDHGAARVSHPADFAQECTRNPLPHLRQYVRGLPLQAMRDGAVAAAEKAAALASNLDAMCTEACDHSGMSDKKAMLLETLRKRCLEAPRLLPQFLATLEAR